MTYDPDTATRAFLRQLDAALAPLPSPERTDVLAELESHLAERAEQGDVQLRAALESLGDPHEYARPYLEDGQLAAALQRAAPASALISILGRAGRSVTAFCVGLGVVTLYSMGLSFAALTVLKPLAPSNVGLWMGHSFQFGFESQPPASPEVLGVWMVPLCALLAVVFYIAGTALVRRGGRLILRRRTK